MISNPVRNNKQIRTLFKDRIEPLYIEHAKVSQKDSSIVMTQNGVDIDLPLDKMTCILWGPGTSLTHSVMVALYQHGVGSCLVGEQGVRYYGTVSPATNSSEWSDRQAHLYDDHRLDTAKFMMRYRYPEVDFSKYTSVASLQGKEGNLVKKVYKVEADKAGVTWEKRRVWQELESSDTINNAISFVAGTLNCLAQVAICSIGANPALGFSHSNQDNAFALDVADTFRESITIPEGIKIATTYRGPDLSRAVRKHMRDYFRDKKLASLMMDRVQEILLFEPEGTPAPTSKPVPTGEYDLDWLINNPPAVNSVVKPAVKKWG